jgi:hypothetical protein
MFRLPSPPLPILALCAGYRQTGRVLQPLPRRSRVFRTLDEFSQKRYVDGYGANRARGLQRNFGGERYGIGSKPAR